MPNAFDLEYLQQRLLQQQPPNRFAEMERNDQEYMQLLEKMDQQELAAEQQQWKQEMQNYYARAAESVGVSGFEGTMDRAGLSHSEFRDYLNHKWFRPINELIEQISADAVAHGGHRNSGLVRKLHEMLSNEKMSREINKYGRMNAQIDAYRDKMAKMPEWQRSLTMNPDINEYMTYDSRTGDYTLNPEYDLQSDDPNAKAQAQSYWSGLGNAHDAFTLDTLRKQFDKAKPAMDTFGISGKKAMADAASVIHGLSPEEQYDVGQELLYKGDKQAFADLHSQEYADLDATYGHARHQDLVDTMNGKKASEQTKREIRKYLGIRDKADDVINKGFQNLQLEYAQRWVSERNPAITEQMRENFTLRMADRYVGTTLNPMDTDVLQHSTVKSPTAEAAESSKTFDDQLYGGTDKSTHKTVYVADGQGLKTHTVYPFNSASSFKSYALKDFNQKWQNVPGFGKSLDRVNSALGELITNTAYVDRDTNGRLWKDESQGSMTGRKQVYVTVEDVKKYIGDALKGTIWEKEYGKHPEKFLQAFRGAGAAQPLSFVKPTGDGTGYAKLKQSGAPDYIKLSINVLPAHGSQTDLMGLKNISQYNSKVKNAMFFNNANVSTGTPLGGSGTANAATDED